MKYRSIMLNEAVVIDLTKFFTKKFAAKGVIFFDCSSMYQDVDQLNDKLLPFESVGLVKNILYQRPFQCMLDVPDEPKLYEFYKLLMLLDDTLVRAYRAYHMRLVTLEQIRKIEKRVNQIITVTKSAMEGEHGT